MTDVYECTRRLEAARRRLSKLEHGGLLLRFLDHLQALGLSPPRVLKYATQLCTLFKNVPFDPVGATPNNKKSPRENSIKKNQKRQKLTLKPLRPNHKLADNFVAVANFK